MNMPMWHASYDFRGIILPFATGAKVPNWTKVNGMSPKYLFSFQITKLTPSFSVVSKGWSAVWKRIICSHLLILSLITCFVRKQWISKVPINRSRCWVTNGILIEAPRCVYSIQLYKTLRLPLTISSSRYRSILYGLFCTKSFVFF